MQRLFESAIGRIDYLLRIIDDENRPKRELTLGESRLRGLRSLLVESIGEVDKLVTCAQSSTKDGDCQAELDSVYQLVFRENET
jgi:hypothetical protein